MPEPPSKRSKEYSSDDQSEQQTLPPTTEATSGVAVAGPAATILETSVQPLKSAVNPSLVKPTKPRKSIPKPMGFLHFPHDIFRRKYESARKSVISPSVVLDETFLAKSGYGPRVIRYLSISGWKDLLERRHRVYVELCWEFFSTFGVSQIGLQDDPDLDAKNTVQFRLCNQRVKVSLNQFAILLGGACGDPDRLICGYPEGWIVDLALMNTHSS